MLELGDQPTEGQASGDLERRIAQLEQNLDTLQVKPAVQVEARHVEPEKPRDGMIVLADGTDWNPGGEGEGFYVYYNAAWTKLLDSLGAGILSLDNLFTGDNEFDGTSQLDGNVTINGSLTTNDPVINNDTVENNSTVKNDGVVTNNERMISNMEVVNKFAANIASASTINLTTSEGNYAHVTGTTTITVVTLETGKWFEVIFDGILILTHHVTNCNLNNDGSNITTETGDRCRFYSDGTTVYGVYIRADGTALKVEAASTTPTRQVFTSSGTWTRPSGCTSINVRVQGGGGTGKSVINEHGGGGGGGGYSEKVIDVTAISSVTVTVGAAGALSKFDTHATGGAGGDASSYVAGLGGAGSGGDINIIGSDGQSGSVGMDIGGSGGSSVLGGGGRSEATGNLYGGGGGGKSHTGSNVGAAGILIVEEFY